ncbi:hypothetical protein E2C01_098615 [Portunus trituberculatus]|uniref:Uncharacterized protein n=1 Tax=Portunus trituberculatus TaxID=210409 RepID=A0A5B7JY96_PORTR|nr:hypothetical protein [Portunus trituberculatus]
MATQITVTSQTPSVKHIISLSLSAKPKQAYASLTQPGPLIPTPSHCYPAPTSTSGTNRARRRILKSGCPCCR